MLKSSDKIAIWMEASIDDDYGKMGISALRYLNNEIICVIDSVFAGKKISEVSIINKDIPIVNSPKDAKNMGANVMLLGVLTSGGIRPKYWDSVIKESIEMGMSIINGLHDQINPEFSQYRVNDEQWIWDTRVPQFTPKIGSAKASELLNKRVLMIGTDMAAGKMTVGLELYSYLRNKNLNVGFIATGQVGITITGSGIPLDAYKLDYACGAVESAVINQKDKDILIVEGQGSILHPGSSATLPLMRGSCPTHMILCHIARNNSLRSLDKIKIPDLKKFIDLNEQVASVIGTYPNAKVIGVALNTTQIENNEALEIIKKVEENTGLPSTDVIRYGGAKIFDELL
ncbi:MAG: DUF1611 domain-containing protein [Bacteroidetes bacterium]|nr:DUF1611 domain-containing protein [Flavobacteriaceae bacterium]MDA0331273.1 DUF1611 domain-containing protein [Bacteroidota bacterium]MDA0885858.1 DUF1611 domain-containing protein [Bacteroidota bacterium]MDA1226156.1 DUF1611 domain-containing protein [Bacteroidota bacterium]